MICLGTRTRIVREWRGVSLLVPGGGDNFFQRVPCATKKWLEVSQWLGVPLRVPSPSYHPFLIGIFHEIKQLLYFGNPFMTPPYEQRLQNMEGIAMSQTISCFNHFLDFFRISFRLCITGRSISTPSEFPFDSCSCTSQNDIIHR